MEENVKNLKEYNKKLIRRGEVLLDLDFLKTWDRKLEEMNEGKIGHLYDYPDSYINFLSVIYYIFGIPYRQLEGFTRALSKYCDLKPVCHSTIYERSTKLNLNINIGNTDDMIISVDASGIKVSNRGKWIREKWKKRRGYLKIHFAVDIKTKNIVSFEVTDESVRDNKKLKDLVEKADERGNVNKVLADGAYNLKEIFDYLEEKRIETGIKVRKNSSTRSIVSSARKKAVLEFKKLGYDKWKEKKGYGHRWMSETVFSCFKNMFGEFI